MKQLARDIVEVVGLALVLAFLLRGFVAETFIVDGPSMQPTLWKGERVVVSKITYRFREPRRGEIVVLRYPYDKSKDFIKRVVAVGGDTVELRLGRLYVNGNLIPEPYVQFPGLYDMKPVQVPKGYVFVLGDHRTNSEDSRVFGPVPLELIKGKALWIIWPPKKMGVLK